MCSVAVRVGPTIAQDAAWQGAGVNAIFQQDLAVDDRVVDADGFFLDAPATGGEVLDHGFLAGRDDAGSKMTTSPARPGRSMPRS